ncbi:hypothetical protein, partial [Micromonospora sp. 4G55]|uniref:hypothetical protein n=1 Tax=Micromonospora sp. 4G55 TaxID=2806102 RepID=UPI001EE3E0B8
MGCPPSRTLSALLAGVLTATAAAGLRPVAALAAPADRSPPSPPPPRRASSAWSADLAVVRW